jgi:pilus assembly protein Flp/PilA
MSEFLAYLRDERAASAAEYAMILAIMGAAIAVALLFLGGTISNAVNKSANCIANAASCAS